MSAPIGAPIGWTFCSGIGAPEMAAPWVDWRLASEIEDFPREVLRRRFGYQPPEDHNQGDPILCGDFTQITPEFARDRGVPLPDILVAGTPCQAFSVAGMRGGTSDPRGNLTLMFVENCHAIIAARPNGGLTVLWENVVGVLSDKDNAFGCFLGGLVGADDPLCAPGGGSWPGAGMVAGPRARCAWRVFDAQYFGVPQRRRRVFLVVDFGGGCDPAAILFERQGVQGSVRPRRVARQAPTCRSGGGIASEGQMIAPIIGFNARQDPDAWSDRVGPLDTFANTQAVAYDLRGRDGGAQFEGPHGTANLRAGAGGSSNSYILDHFAVRRLMPVEAHRLQGFPDHHCAIHWRGKTAPDRRQFKALGNSMAVPNIAWIMDRVRLDGGWP